MRVSPSAPHRNGQALRKSALLHIFCDVAKVRRQVAFLVFLLMVQVSLGFVFAFELGKYASSRVNQPKRCLFVLMNATIRLLSDLGMVGPVTSDLLVAQLHVLVFKLFVLLRQFFIFFDEVFDLQTKLGNGCSEILLFFFEVAQWWHVSDFVDDLFFRRFRFMSLGVAPLRINTPKDVLIIFTLQAEYIPIMIVVTTFFTQQAGTSLFQTVRI